MNEKSSLEQLAALRRENRELRQQLERSDKNLQTFLYAIAHDLRAPVRHISSFTEILEEDMGEAMSEEDEETFSHIKAASVRLGLMIDGLLLLSRNRGHRTVRQEVNLAHTVQHAYSVTEKLEQRGRLIGMEMVDLPIIHSDQAMVGQVFNQLLSNSLKFTRNTDPSTIRVSSNARAEGIEVVVADDGVGFDMKHAGRLFQLFQRLDSSGVEGTGIGLVIVKELMTSLGGQVTIEASPGRGCEVHLLFPN
ncbi:MAG: ATP-binding protein [Saprospiraceae bacterium]